jgi:hypothetical protein
MNSSISNIVGESNNNNKRQKTSGTTTSATTMTTMTTYIPLKLSMSFLHPRDLLNCIQTCKQWKKEIDTDGVWADVSKSLSSTNAVESIRSISRINSNNNDGDNDDDNDDGQSPVFNFRTIALALAREYVNDDSNNAKEPDYPKPSLKLKNVIVVIEFRNKDTKQHIGAWSSDLTDFQERDDYGQRKIEYSSSNDIKTDRFLTVDSQETVVIRNGFIVDIGEYEEGALERLEMRSRFIRGDTGQCFCINNYIRSDHYNTTDGGSFDIYRLKPTGLNKFASVARELFFFNDYNSVEFEVSNVRMVSAAANNEYKIDAFQFIMRVAIGKETNEEVFLHNRDFKNLDHALLFLEALDWK